MSQTEPQSNNAQRVLLSMCVIIAVIQLGFGAVVPVLPLYAKSFDVSASAIGATIAAYGLARMISALPSGGLCDWLGRRPTLLIGGVISALGNLGCVVARNYPEFLVARFASGFGAGLVLTAGAIVLADISPARRRGRNMATYNGVFLFAVGIGPWPGGLLAEHFGLSAPFAVYAVASLLAGIIAWLAVPETRTVSAAASASAGESASANSIELRRSSADVPKQSFLQQIRLLSGNTGFMLICLFGLINAVVRTGGMFNVVPVLADAKLGLTTSQIGGGLALGSILGLLASYPAGALSDRVGRKPVIVPSAFLTAAALLAFCFAPSFGWFVVASLFWGVAASINGAGPAAYVSDIAPAGMNAAAMSQYRVLSDLGYVVGPIFLGLLADQQGPEVTLVVAAAMVAAIGLLFARYAPETHRR